MIIGINGKIGSGKDTVGKIIQYLIATNNLPKDMQYESIDDLDHNVETFSNWKIKKFAGKLKTIASILTGIPVEKFEDQEFKKVILGEEWATVKPNPLNAIPVFENVQFNALMSVRELLQKLGTEAMRDGLHTNVWVNALFADYKPFGKSFKDVSPVTGGVTFDTVGVYPNWIITDMRFENELEAVVERKGITIRVVRPKPREMFLMNATTVIDTRIPEHPSETALDNAEFDYEIINDGTIDELVEKVKEILIKEKLI